MGNRMKKAVFAATLVSGIGAVAVGCGLLGTIDFSISFRPPNSPRAVGCVEAMVASTQVIVFDRDLNAERVNVENPCTSGDRVRVTLELGNYLVTIRGMNGQRTICYESVIPVRIDPGTSKQYSFEAQAHPTGAQGGCQYPTITQ